MDAALDHERCYRAVASRDARFDGSFYTAVRTTGIYCRPSCPAITPEARERHLLPDGRGRPARRVPGMSAVPSRCGSRIGGVERARGCRGPLDAARRRRRRRAGRGRGDRCCARLQRAAPQPTGDRGARGRAAGDRPHAAGPHRADPAGDHRPARQRGGVGGWVREHPVVQRHDRAVYGESPTRLRARRSRGGAVARSRAGTGRRAAVGLARAASGAAHAPIRVRLATRQPFDAARPADVPGPALRSSDSRSGTGGRTGGRSASPRARDGGVPGDARRPARGVPARGPA